MKDTLGDRPFEPAFDPRFDSMVRTSDPDTSHGAAAAIVPDLNALQAKVLSCCRSLRQFTDLDLHYRCIEVYGRQRESTYRKRRGELRDLGLVEDTGSRVMQEGSSRIIWRITAEGLK
jgi:hypothetical protein